MRPYVVVSCLVLAAAAAAVASGDDGSVTEEPFRDVTAESGIDFVHFIGASGELFVPETMGSGVGLFDYDGDGDLDLYLVQGAMLGGDRTVEQSSFPLVGPSPPMDRLYRNDSGPPFRFTDVTPASGIRALGYGMGVASADYDGDGDVDLYVTNYGSNQLWRNDGTLGGGELEFSDVTREAGVDDSRWSIPALFFDYDGDGDLDLYVGNYTNFRVATNKECRSPAGYRDYCSPRSYDPEPDRLFRNRGNGRFEDVSERSGIGGVTGNALGAVAADFDGDGRLDLYVANDQMPNRLWHNRGDGSFEDRALLAGCAVNGLGSPEASMGVDAGDFDGDGDVDLFLTHLGQETNTLYVNDGSGSFEDRSTASGLGAPSWPFTAFGTAWLDYDNDGRLDLLAANGAVFFIPELLRQGDPYPLHQPNQLFRNLGEGRFEEIRGVAALRRSEVSRGVAVGDIDNDGDLDVVLSNSNGPARLLRNEVGRRRSWLGLRLVDAAGRDRLGARAALLRDGEPPLWRIVQVSGSYASARDPRLLFGLGDAAAAVTVRVHWPQGRLEEFRDLAIDAYHTLVQGRGGSPERVP